MNNKSIEHQSDVDELNSTSGTGIEQLNPSQESLDKLAEAKESLAENETELPLRQDGGKGIGKRPSFGCVCSNHCGTNFGLVKCTCDNHCGTNYGKE